MPRRAKGARLWLRPEVRDPVTGAVKENAVWIIRDGSVSKRTGCAPGELERAEQALSAYIATRHKPPRTSNRDPDQIMIADVLNIYVTDIVARHARPKETASRIGFLAQFWGRRKLSEVSGRTCREYAAQRSTAQAARRELEDLRSAINHHRREGLCSQVVEVVLPEKSVSRERWLTRSEAARLVWAAYRYREVQKGVPTDRRSRRHVARFILIALYTGTRAAPVCGAAFVPGQGRGWIDLERGVFYRRAEGVRETKKRAPAVPLPGRLLAHLRRWKRLGLCINHPVEFGGEPVLRVTKSFARAAADAGLGPDVTPHVLRHTAATWAMQNRADIRETAGFLGMTLETMERVYAHHHPDHLRSASEAIAGGRAAQLPHRNGVNKREQTPSDGAKIIGFTRSA